MEKPEMSSTAAPSVDATDSILNVSSSRTSHFVTRVAAESSVPAAMAMDPLSHVGDGIFLQTKTAQGIAGAFVWVALFLTCQQ
uniref:Uncharacterized protein n=1 Tax=Phlebotomus papatasi TaxID=29031 RepID=A0A1B0EZZ4_PHLPP